MSQRVEQVQETGAVHAGRLQDAAHARPRTGSTLAATARRLGIAIPTVRSYLDRIRAKWAATDEPVQDVRALIHEYPRHLHPNGPA